MITGAVTDVLRPVSGASDSLLTTSVHANRHALAASASSELALHITITMRLHGVYRLGWLGTTPAPQRWGSLFPQNAWESAFPPPADPPRQALSSCPASCSLFF
jgi:hypothetical protein